MPANNWHHARDFRFMPLSGGQGSGFLLKPGWSGWTHSPPPGWVSDLKTTHIKCEVSVVTSGGKRRVPSTHLHAW